MQGIKGNWNSDGNDIPDREAFKWNKVVQSPGMALWYQNTGPWWSQTTLHDNDGTSLEEEQADSTSIWQFYKKLIGIRRTSSAIRLGSFSKLNNTNSNVFSFIRSFSSDTSNQSVAVIINLANSNQSTNLDFTSTIMLLVSICKICLNARSLEPLVNANRSSYPLSLNNYGISIINIQSGNVSIPKETSNKIQIYPNPFLENFYIDNSLGIVKTVEIDNLFGRKMKVVSQGEAVISINTHDFMPGMYIVTLTLGSGERVVSKLVKI